MHGILFFWDNKMGPIVPPSGSRVFRGAALPKLLLGSWVFRSLLLPQLPLEWALAMWTLKSHVPLAGQECEDPY